MDIKLPGPVDASFKPEVYWAYLDDMDLTDDQKTSILEALWSIMAAFVDLGFGADSVQFVLPAIVYAGLSDEDKASIAQQSFGAAARMKQEEESCGGE